MNDLDDPHDANQTNRATATSGHMTTNSGHTKSKYGNAHEEWLASRTPEEMEAYRRGCLLMNIRNRRYIVAAQKYRITLRRIARGEYKDPAAAARYALSTLGDDE